MSAVKQCAYLLSATSQVIQGSLKFCQGWLRADQSTDGPGSPFTQQAQEKSCPAQSQGMVQWFPHSPHNREALRELSSSPTTPSAALRHPSALCSTEKTQGALAHVGQLWGASCEWTWQIQVSLSLFSLAHHAAQALPRWQPSLCHDCQRRVHDDTAYILKNKVLSLLVTPPKPNLLVTFFIAENNHHWIHSVLMTYIHHRGCCSKNKRTDSSLNICSPANHFLSLNSGTVKLYSSCTFPQIRSQWPLLEDSWAAGSQVRLAKASLVSFLLSLHPSLPML